MKVHALFFLLAAPVALCQTPDLITVLQSDPDTKGFGDLLDQYPDLVTSLNTTKQYTVFAPSNDAVAAFRANLNSSGAIIGRSNRLDRRTISSFAASIALLFTDRSNQANFNTQPTDLFTNLTDPAYINVSPAANSATLTQSSSSTSSSASSTSTSTSIQSTSSSVSSTSSSVQPTTSSATSTASSAQSTLTTASTVQSPASTSSSSPPPPPAPSPNAGLAGIPKMKTINSKLVSKSHSRRQSSNSTISVYSGFGDIASVSLSETPYSGGAIRTVDSFFTLFGDLPTTLAQTNGTAFSAALSQANTLSSLSNTARITVFVPNDAALKGHTLDANALKRYILFDTLATTTTLATANLTSSAGENVNATILPNGTYSVNGLNIVGENTLIKNGVIHYIDGLFPTPTYTGAAPMVKTSVLPATAVAIAILVSYMGMAGF
ncbi:hypothetical protein NA56DRAFT_695230 [Hyaloscypha hepaticicola]|uniref:FAS1 domain-containing protein n=1 Tax=Hyaloscypha hepaticicola TaxID=2082293 RepID=A0A2J6PFP4_9HELO|nr:hypothetical protein NA56DRAFT_695230 [Hyaloscypha hepaticicola]